MLLSLGEEPDADNGCGDRNEKSIVVYKLYYIHIYL